MGRKPKSQSSNGLGADMVPASTAEIVPAMRRALSPIQLKMLDDESRRIVARCSRRAGKTYWDIFKLIIVCLLTPNARTAYFGLTEDSAKQIIWLDLIHILVLFRVAHSAKETDLEIYFPNGSQLIIRGLDDKRVRVRLRGLKFHLVIIDEMAFYTHIDDIVKDVIGPTLADFDGQLILNSSPGELAKGMFYHADVGEDSENWSQYHWTGADNPFFINQKPRNPAFATRWEELLANAVKTDFRGDDTHPKFQREWQGKWAFTKNALVYPYDTTNDIAVEYPVTGCQYAMCLNLAEPGTQGIVVIKHGDTTKDVQVVEASKHRIRNIDELATVLGTYIDDFSLHRVIVYLGDHSKRILEEFRSRYVLPLTPCRYEKLPMYQSIVSADIEAGRIRALARKCPGLLSEWSKISKNDRDEELKHQDTLLADAFFAVYMESYTTHIRNVIPAETEEERMQRELLESIRREREENEDYYGGTSY